ncbi:LLM class flavin-dependent oxidoreductase [Actinophytocola sp.]|uniref:LLM class flavin-dependent oxidoreductase n=1 Tax=Actinophytocola sp. TaxID=1872138 RepID=UPI003D6A0B5F
MKVGVLVMDEDLTAGCHVARAADAAGVHSLWTIDYYNRNSLVRAATFAAVTESAVVGTSVTPLFARSALATATAAADVQAVAGGRFALGVGSSTRRMNSDWYGFDLAHPAPRMSERIGLVRALLEHGGGPFSFEGRWESVSFAHLDHAVKTLPVPIYAAGVGEGMLDVAGRTADGFVGHPIASAAYLKTVARPRVIEAARRAARAEPPRFLTQVIASVDEDRAVARRRAAAQVGFYATVKGYDPLFPGDPRHAERDEIRRAFRAGDARAVAAAADGLVDERAVFGTVTEVAEQLRRYEPVADVVQLYSPHFGVSPDEIAANERSLIEVAACWNS